MQEINHCDIFTTVCGYFKNAPLEGAMGWYGLRGKKTFFRFWSSPSVSWMLKARLRVSSSVWVYVYMMVRLLLIHLLRWLKQNLHSRLFVSLKKMSQILLEITFFLICSNNSSYEESRNHSRNISSNSWYLRLVHTIVIYLLISN